MQRYIKNVILVPLMYKFFTIFLAKYAKSMLNPYKTQCYGNTKN